MTTTNVRCVNVGSMLANTNNVMVDQSTYNNAELPAGSMIRNIYVRKTATLTSAVNIKIGVSSDNEYIIPSGHLTSTMLNDNEYVVYYPVGAKKALTANSEVVVVPDANCGGSIEVFVRYELWADLA